jgi:hypothetical protein
MLKIKGLRYIQKTIFYSFPSLSDFQLAIIMSFTPNIFVHEYTGNSFRWSPEREGEEAQDIWH